MSYFQSTKLIDNLGVAQGLKFVDGKPRVSAMSYLYDIAEGNITGHTAWSKIGYNSSVDSAAQEDIWAAGGTYVWPTGEMGMELLSSSIEDDPIKADLAIGTGVHAVTIFYLNAAGVEKSEDVTLNGTGVVATVATDIKRVNAFRSKTVGTAGKAVGNISLRHISDSPVYGQISAGYTRARTSAYTVPAGKTLYITSANFSSIGAASGKDVIFTLRATYDDKALALRAFFVPFIEIGVVDGAISLEFTIPIRLPAGVDLIVSGIAGNNASKCSSIIRGWLE
jgi:hypothetical protein